MRRDSLPQARSVAPEPAARFHVKNWPRLPRPCCAEKAASHFSDWNDGARRPARGMRDVLMVILTATCAGSSPALPVICNVLDRHDGREGHGRVVRTSGRRGICRRDHARRRSPAHFERLCAQSCSAATSAARAWTPASVIWPGMDCDDGI